MENKIKKSPDAVNLFARRSRDWFFLLAAASLGAILLALLNWFLFVRPLSPLGAGEASNTVSFSRADLDTVLATFEMRQAQYDSVRRTLHAVADPGK